MARTNDDMLILAHIAAKGVRKIAVGRKTMTGRAMFFAVRGMSMPEKAGK